MTAKIYGRLLVTFSIKNKQSHKKIVNINHNNSSIDNKQMISETFNEFFCNIGSKLANKFSNNNIEAYKTYLNLYYFIELIKRKLKMLYLS